MELKQYLIVLANLNLTIGSEMKKPRPCVILSPDEMNKHLQTIIVAPMTSTIRAYPSRVEIKHKKTSGWIVLDQIRTVDRLRIIKILDTLSDGEISKIKAVIKETYVD